MAAPGKDNSSRNWAILSIAASFLFSWLFSQYGEPVLGIFFPIAVFLWPVVLVTLGFFAGWQFKKWRVSKLFDMTLEEAVAKLQECADCETKSPEDPNPYGFSKRALAAWNLMEDRDRRSLGNILGASVLRGATPVYPLILDMDGSLADIGLDVSMIKSLEAIGILEGYPQRALQPFYDTNDGRLLLDGIDAYRGEATFSTMEGLYSTKGCTAQFCVPGDFASPPMQCVDLGLYGFTDIAQEILPHIEPERVPDLFSYLDKAYQKRRGAERPFSKWTLGLGQVLTER